MNMKKLLTASVLSASLLLSACAGGSLGTSDPNALAKSLITACESAAVAENTIAALIRAGQIKPVSFPAINQFREPIKAFCDPSAAIPEDLVGASKQVVAATVAMLALQPKR